VERASLARPTFSGYQHVAFGYGEHAVLESRGYGVMKYWSDTKLLVPAPVLWPSQDF
jgi:hypothetical protein